MSRLGGDVDLYMVWFAAEETILVNDSATLTGEAQARQHLHRNQPMMRGVWLNSLPPNRIRRHRAATQMQEATPNRLYYYMSMDNK